MSTRKQLKLQIAAIEQTIRLQQAETNRHVQYFSSFMKDGKAMILLTLVPFFIIGWKSARKGRALTIIKQAIQLAILTAVTQVKSKVWLSITRALT